MKMNNNSEEERILTHEELLELHQKKISSEMREVVERSLPSNMHIDNRNVLRYKHISPNSLKALKTQRNPGFKKGQSGFAGRKHLSKKFLRQVYEEYLHKKGQNNSATIAEEFVDMHYTMLKKSFKKANATNFSKLLTDFASISGNLEKEKDVPEETTINAQNVVFLPASAPLKENKY